MATFTIEAPDGRKIKVEADTPENATAGAQEWAAANPLSAPKGGDAYKGEVTVGSIARSLFAGIPFVGGYGDEMRARLKSSVGSGTYDENVTGERAKQRAFEKEHPYLDTGLKIGGGVGATVAAAPAVGGAGIAATLGRLGLGLGARTLPGAIGRGAVAGTLQGAAAGSGEAEGDFVNRGMGAITGAAVGGVAGAAIPATVEGVRRVGANVINRATGQGGPLSELSSGARRYVGEISDPARVTRMQADLQRLGPDAMLPDVSPEWMGVARGAAGRPGSRDTVVDALTDRSRGSNARLQTDLDANLGPAPIPSRVEAGIERGREAVGPQYDAAFANGRAVQSQALADNLDARLVNARGPSRSALGEVRAWLNIPGTNELDPNPEALHQVRRAIDGLLDGNTNRTVVRDLTIARGEVDRLLANAAPGVKTADAQYRELSRQSEALTRGGQLLNTDRASAIRPQELAQELTEGALPQGQLVGPSAVPLRLQQGLRAEVDRVVGTSGNDARAVQRMMRGSEADGDWNPQKMGMVFGEDRAGRALGAVDREVTFQNTAQRVAGGSDTAMGRGFQEFLDRAERPITGASGGADMTGWGTAINTAKRIGTVLTGALGQQRANRYATELARASIAQGVTRDEFVTALQQAGVQQGLISRTLDLATRGGLIVSREGAGRVQELTRPESP